MIKVGYIKQISPGKWRVVSRTGKNLGTYTSRMDAEKRLKQVEMFKHMDKKRKKAEVLRDLAVRFKLAGEHDLSDKILCALAGVSGAKNPKPHLSYSYVMRKLRKEDANKALKFQEAFKRVFDEAVKEDLENTEGLALMAGIKAVDFEDE